MTSGEEKTPPKSVDSHVRNFCQYTTTHGFSRLDAARYRRVSWRMFWIFILIGAHSLFYYHTYMIIKDYLARPIRTKVTMKHGKNMIFPTLTLCNLNILRKSKVPLSLTNHLSKITNTTTIKAGFGNKTRKAAGKTLLANPDRKHTAQEEWERFRKLYYQYDKDDLQKYGHQLQDMVLDCSFNGEDCSMHADDEAFTWRHIWMDDVGNCYMFNRALDDDGKDVEPYKSPLAGDQNGLRLILNIEQYEYLDGISPYAGLSVAIASQGHMPFPKSNGIDLAPGFSTSIELRMNYVTRLDPFKNDSCENSGELENLNVFAAYNMTYTQMACKVSCLVSMQIEKCACAQYFSFETDYESCDITNASVSQCLNEVYDLFLDGRCDARCPPPCKEAYFTTTISSSKWPSNSYKNKLKEILKEDNKTGMTDEEITDNLIELHVYYADLDYVHVEETLKYEFQDIISNVGGQLGMWIGVSAISIAEVIELFIIVVNFVIDKKKARRTAADS